VSVQPSRRAFISGQRSNVDPWLSFLSKLRGQAKGTLTLDPQLFEVRAHWVPTSINDIESARALCQQYGVILCLQGLEALIDPKRLTLVVEPGRAWARPIPLDLKQGLWRFEAACSMQVLQAVGIMVAQGAQPSQSLAHWFAQGTHQNMTSGGLSGLGIENIEMMFADGTIEVMGAFGAQNSEPLRSMFTQRNIPQLFEVARQSSVQAVTPTVDKSRYADQVWPTDCFRIDALRDHDGAEPHLGHFFVGHGGRLGWLVAVTFRSIEAAAGEQKDDIKFNDKASDCANLNMLFHENEPDQNEIERSETERNEVLRVNQSIKNIFDSPGVFLP
jgi:hypothetical protein